MLHENQLQTYHKFHNRMRGETHDKLVRATLSCGMGGLSEANRRSANLHVTVQMRKGDWLLPDPFVSEEVVETLLQKHFHEWDAIDAESALAILDAVKRFDQLAPEKQEGQYFECYDLGHCITTADMRKGKDVAVGISKSVSANTPTHKLDSKETILKAARLFNECAEDFGAGEKARIAGKILKASLQHKIDLPKGWAERHLGKALLRYFNMIQVAKRDGWSKDRVKKAMTNLTVGREITQVLDHQFTMGTGLPEDWRKEEVPL